MAAAPYSNWSPMPRGPVGPLNSATIFCAKGGEQCLHGDTPLFGLFIGASGILYGTTVNGGTYRNGTVYQLTPGPTVYTQKVLYSFCAHGGFDCTDGSFSQGHLVADKSGDLFGATDGGGTVFELSPPKAGETAWAEKVLYSFCAQGGQHCTDGLRPLDLQRDASGDLFGVTALGGAHGQGVAFALVPPKAGKTAWTLEALYSFCAQQKCSDGATPILGMISDASGNLYGQTAVGGASQGLSQGGTIFELIPNAPRTIWTHKVLYRFCAQKNCADGMTPDGIFRDASGNIFGTTLSGVGTGCGGFRPAGGPRRHSHAPDLAPASLPRITAPARPQP
jgi:hypothetical protein